MPHPVANDQLLVPYISSWSTEEAHKCAIIERVGIGIAYADETILDRDNRGVLWYRVPNRPRQGRPRFGDVHPLRQRRVMHRLLCQVCANPADHTDDGVLWLLKDHRTDWSGWPNNMTVTEPPVCLSCARVAATQCPALRRGAAAIRARGYPVYGVAAQLYKAGPDRMPVPSGEDIVAYADPIIRWARATELVRRLHDCTILDLDNLAR